MAFFDEIASGGMKAHGCASLSTYGTIASRFVEGDVAYDVQKAKQGRLEKIVIKLIRPVKPTTRPVANKVLYQDTFNALWNEYDLVPLDVASALIAAYQQKMQEERQRLPCG